MLMAGATGADLFHMASRTKQKEEARARRLAEEQARAEQARRNRRLQMLGGVVILAIVVVVVAVIVSSGGGNESHAPKIPTTAKTRAQKHAQQAALQKAIKQDAPVFALLSGIPQHGNTLGSPTAKVTVVEYGDLQCPICRDFTLSSEHDLIKNDVRAGKVKLVYKSLETATGGAPDPKIFGPQQAAAYAAGLQNHAWDYIELFYHQQGAEGTGYVNQGFLDNLAKQIKPLNFSQWQSDSKSSALLAQVKAEGQDAAAKGFNATPTIIVSGPKGQATPVVGNPQSFSQLETLINEVQ
jgi:protein-disulfide isomerase